MGDIYKNKMTIPSSGIPWAPADIDRWTEEDGSEDEGLISESWSPKTEPATEPSSPLQYNFDIDDNISLPDIAPHASPNHLD